VSIFRTGGDDGGGVGGCRESALADDPAANDRNTQGPGAFRKALRDQAASGHCFVNQGGPPPVGS